MIDTAQKRFSMIGFGRVPSPLVFEPDGAVNADDMYMLVGLYSGITLDAPTIPTETILDYARGFGRGIEMGIARGMN